MKQLEHTLQDLKCMLIEDGYKDDNIVLRTLIKAQQKVKNLNIPVVINRRELLIDFLMEVDEVYGMHIREDAEKCADNYLKSINSL